MTSASYGSEVEVRQFAFGIARSRPAGAVVRLMFGRFSRLLPLERLAASKRVALYRHPRPVYGSTHLLAVPLRGIRDISSLASNRHDELRAELWQQTAQWQARYETPWMLVNAGSRQDVFQVHFHLSDECPPDVVLSDETFGNWELALAGLGQLTDGNTLLKAGFGLLCGPDGRVHTATSRRPCGAVSSIP